MKRFLCTGCGGTKPKRYLVCRKCWQTKVSWALKLAFGTAREERDPAKRRARCTAAARRILDEVRRARDQQTARRAARR